MTLSSKQAYADSEGVLGPFLAARGFHIAQPGEFLREDRVGEDRILVDWDERRGRFAVFLCFYPSWTEELRQLIGDSRDSRGFPCGPYLTPAGVQRREAWWPGKSLQILERSLQRVVQALEHHGLEWLASLRDPAHYAEQVDPIAALYKAWAYERAGQPEVARRFYEEVLRRVSPGQIGGLLERDFVDTLGKQYVFVSGKLGMAGEDVRRVAEQLGPAAPQVSPLPISNVPLR